VALLALSVVAACGAGSTGAARAPAPVQFPIRDFHLRSGMRIVVEEDHSAPVVGVVTVVGAGSTNDPPGKEGLAHLVEHLTFRANHAPAQNLSSLFDQAGATDVNGVTAWDYSLYQEFGAADTLHDLLTLEGLRLVDPLAKLDDATFDVEREVVKNELLERGETNVAGTVFGALQGASFPSTHPYARPVGGTVPSISSLTLDDARAFAQENYRPANVTLLVIGDVKLDRMEALFASSLSSTLNDPAPGAVAAGPRLPAQAPEVPSPPRQEAIVRIEGHVAAPELYVAWPLPRAFAEGSYLGVLALTGTRNALDRADSHDPDIVGTSATIRRGVQASLLVGHVVLREGADPQRSLTRVLDELYRNWALDERPLVADVRFSHERMRLVTGTMIDAQDIRARAIERAEYAHFAGDVTMYSKNMSALARVDREQLVKFYETYLNRERARAVLVRPKLEARGAGPTRSGPREVHDQARVTYDLASIPGIARPLGLASGFQHEVLDNGLVVDTARRGTMPVVAVGISFRGGIAEEKRPGAAELALLAAVPSQMQGHMEDVGAWMQRSATSDELTFRVYVLAQYLGYALDVLADHVRSLRVHENAVRELEWSYFPYAQKARALPERVADRAFRQALFGSLPFATTGELPQEGHPSAGEANDWLEAVLTPRRAVLAIVGDVDPAEATRLAKSAFGGWSDKGPASQTRTEDGEQPPREDEPPALAAAGVHAAILVPRPDATQAEVRIACRLAPAHAAEALRYQVLARAVDARLNGSIRQAMGLSYGFHAHAETLLGGSAVLYLHGSIENAGLLPALQAVRQVLGGSAGLTSGDLDAGRWAVARGYDIALATPSAWLSRALDVERRGWGLEVVDAEPRLLASFDSAGLIEALHRCAKEGVISIVGDEPTARWALAKAWP
jgi:zinc protease